MVVPCTSFLTVAQNRLWQEHQLHVWHWRRTGSRRTRHRLWSRGNAQPDVWRRNSNGIWRLWIDPRSQTSDDGHGLWGRGAHDGAHRCTVQFGLWLWHAGRRHGDHCHAQYRLCVCVDVWDAIGDRLWRRVWWRCRVDLWHPVNRSRSSWWLWIQLVWCVWAAATAAPTAAVFAAANGSCR